MEKTKKLWGNILKDFMNELTEDEVLEIVDEFLNHSYSDDIKRFYVRITEVFNYYV